MLPREMRLIMLYRMKHYVRFIESVYCVCTLEGLFQGLPWSATISALGAEPEEAHTGMANFRYPTCVANNRLEVQLYDKSLKLSV